MDRKLIEARLNLAKHFLQHSARRLFAPKEADGTGLLQFLSKYGSDNIYQLATHDRERYSSFSRCIQCSICQPYCVMFRAIGYLDFPGPMAVASTLSRGLDQLGTTNGVIYNCTLCRLCEVSCPEGAPIAELVRFVRRYIFEYFPELVPAAVKEMNELAKTKGTIFDTPLLECDMPKKESAEYVLFLGCHNRYSQKERLEAAVLMLNNLAIDFTTIEEVCCGAPLNAVGSNSSGELARINIERIREKKTAKVITLCPHCLIAFSEEKEYAGKIEATHIAEFIPHMRPPKKGSEIVTYHDPCMLGRVAGIMEEPRKALESAGVNLVEMSSNREMAACCGNWGGLNVTSHAAAKAIGAKRLDDARAVGADVLLTECPWCLDNFTSISLTGKKLRIRSVIEYMINPEL